MTLNPTGPLGRRIIARNMPSIVAMVRIAFRCRYCGRADCARPVRES